MEKLNFCSRIISIKNFERDQHPPLSLNYRDLKLRHGIKLIRFNLISRTLINLVRKGKQKYMLL